MVSAAPPARPTQSGTPYLLDKPEGVPVGGPHWRSLCGVQGASSTSPWGHLEKGGDGVGSASGGSQHRPQRDPQHRPAHQGRHFWHISQEWSGEQKVPGLQAHWVLLSARQGLSSTWSAGRGEVALTPAPPHRAPPPLPSLKRRTTPSRPASLGQTKSLSAAEYQPYPVLPQTSPCPKAPTLHQQPTMLP